MAHANFILDVIVRFDGSYFCYAFEMKTLALSERAECFEEYVIFLQRVYANFVHFSALSRIVYLAIGCEYTNLKRKVAALAHFGRYDTK